MPQEPSNIDVLARDMGKHAMDELGKDRSYLLVDFHLLTWKAREHVMVLSAVFNLLHQTNGRALDDLASLERLPRDDEAIYVAPVGSGRTKHKAIRVGVRQGHFSTALPLQCFLVVVVLDVRSGFVLDEHAYNHVLLREY
jgi:hypothetical protein